MLDIIGKRRYGYLLSGVFVVVGLLFILATLIPNGNVGLQFSIAYTGGTVWEIGFRDGTPAPAEVRAVLTEQGLPDSEVAITSADDRDYVLIRTEELALQAPEVVEGSAAAALAAQESAEPAAPEASPTAEPAAPEATPVTAATPAAAASPEAERTEPPVPVVTAVPAATDAPEAITETPAPTLGPDASPLPDASPAAGAAGVGGDGDGPALPSEGRFGELAAALQAAFGPIDEVRQENTVGPVVSAELVYQTFLLILIAAVAIMIWVSYRFRDVIMGGSALLALLHDVIVTVGAFALFGTFIGLQIDALFVTAMLTVIGFSVHDTIVVFDRIRENRQRYIGQPLELITNHSLVQTIGRSLTTSLTLIFTLVALLLFGGEAIRGFTLALLIGVVAGTYSSIFVATPLFLDWHTWDERRKASRPVDAKAKARTSTI